jgi:phosphoadenosine phosphosulfate reductase
MSSSALPAMCELSDTALVEVSAHLESASATTIVQWALDTFGDRIAVTASMADAALVHLVSSLAPGVDVLFADTGYHFPETLATAAAVSRKYPVELKVVSAALPLDDLWRSDPDACCARRKTGPIDEAILGYDAWLSGLRRDESHTRADTPIVSRGRNGRIRIYPLARWTDADVAEYIARNDVIVNPLLAQGYPSIGCAPCTRRVDTGEHARAGRWSGLAKTECGLHL